MNTDTNKLVVIGIAVFLAGGVVSMIVDPYLPTQISNTQKSYTEGFTAARKVAEESQYGSYFRTPDDMRSLTGLVTETNGDQLVLKLSSVVSPFDDPALATRTVRISPDTKVVKLVAKDPKVFQAELAKFNASPSAGAAAPRPYTETSVSAEAIKIGDLVTVTTAENVKAMKEFTASEVRVELSMASQ